MKRTKWTPAGACLALALALGGCVRDNAAYCDDTHPCGTGTCRLDVHRCVAGPGGDAGEPPDVGVPDGGGADLPPGGCPVCSGAAPICVATQCVPCDVVLGTGGEDGGGGGEAACALATPAAPHCLLSGSDHGACVACRDGGDCLADPHAPICDATTHACRACASDNDCASKVCDLQPGSPSFGQCATNVIYVDKNNTGDADGSMAKPFPTIDKGLQAAKKAGGSPVVRIAAAGGSAYNEQPLVTFSVTLVGETGAVITPAPAGPALRVQGNDPIVVTVRNLSLSGANSGGSGLECQAMNGTVTVLGCTVAGNAFYGIDANTCGLLAVDRSFIGGTNAGNLAGGIRVGINYRLTNNIIYNNGSITGSSGGGIVINSVMGSGPHEILANTIVGNHASGPGGGIACPTGNNATILGNILTGNQSDSLPNEAPACTTSYSCTDDATDGVKPTNVLLTSQNPLGFDITRPFHLSAASACKDKGPPAGQVPAYDYDGEPRPDATTQKTDIGADELQP